MKWTRRISIILIVLAGLITALWWEENWRGQKIWEESCARLRAAGEPVEMADVIPPMIPDEENVAAAPIFTEVTTASNLRSTRLGKISDGWQDQVKRSGVLFPLPRPMSPSDQTYMDLWAQTMRKTFPKAPPTGPFRSSADEVVHFYAQFDHEWSELRTALKRPRCRWPLADDDGFQGKAPHLDLLQPLVFSSRGWVAALAAEGDEVAFTNLLVSLFKLERTIGKAPRDLMTHIGSNTMARSILGVWQDSLPLVSLSDAQLLELQNLLAQYHLQDAEIACRNERVFLAHAFAQLPVRDLINHLEYYGVKSRFSQGSWSWSRGIEETVVDAALVARPRGWELADLAGVQDGLQSVTNGCVDRARDILVKSKVEGMRAEAERLGTSFGFYTLSRHEVDMWVEVYQRLLQHTGIVHATMRSAMVWCAAERFRLKCGHFPKSQEEMIPEFLRTPIVDPIDGRPLRYVLKREDCLLVYSLGWDGKDDGGVRGKRMEREGDFGWASDPMILVGPHEVLGWKKEDAERAARAAPPSTARKSRKPRPGSAP